MKMDILAYEDVLAQVADSVLAMLYRGQWVIPLAASYREFVEKLPQLALGGELVGEVFSEEGRELTETYRRAVLLVAEGY